MNILEDLYYGNIIPYEHDLRYRNKYDRLMEQIIQNEKVIHSALTDEQQEAFDAFQNDAVELASITELESFTKGFTLAARLMIEVLAPATDLLES